MEEDPLLCRLENKIFYHGATPLLRSRSSLICVRVQQNLEPKAIQANLNISDQP